MALSYKRSVRVGEIIQQAVSKIVRDMTECLDLGFVTIMHVKLTDDLLSCRIYYSMLGSDKDKKKIYEILMKNTKKVRHQLALYLNLRRTPAINFVYDNTTENATRIFDLLKKIEEEK
ncbi:MAG: 30S ribosome-binding factor RbfA [Endomicrobium sp.]|jgi:ribosome-binding factor A|nr:30S ribosome-binding factor RbfA [Endomicrobium sp.]